MFEEFEVTIRFRCEAESRDCALEIARQMIGERGSVGSFAHVEVSPCKKAETPLIHLVRQGS